MSSLNAPGVIQEALAVCGPLKTSKPAHLVKLGTRGACDKLGTRECPGVPLRDAGEGGAATGLMRCRLKLLKLLFVWRLQVPHTMHTLPPARALSAHMAHIYTP